MMITENLTTTKKAIIFGDCIKFNQDEINPELKIDNKGKIIFANPMMTELLGKEKGDIIGNYLTNMLIPNLGNSRIFHYKWQSIKNGNSEFADFILTNIFSKKYIIRFNTSLKKNTNQGPNEIIFRCIQIKPILEYAIKREIAEGVFA